MEWVVEFSEEVRVWYVGLTPVGKAGVDRAFELLATRGNALRMPHTRSTGGGLYELRFTCEGLARRVTCVSDPDRHVITLATFHKQRTNERTEILRARRAQAAHRHTDPITGKDAIR